MSRSKNGDAGQPKAAGRSEVEDLRAENERLRGEVEREAEGRAKLAIRLRASEAKLRALDALADEWDTRVPWRRDMSSEAYILRAVLARSQAPAEHAGGNGEDCPICSRENLPYPFLCREARK